MPDPVSSTLTNLLSAYGYNLYDQKNRARADDLLVREKAAEDLAQASSAVRSLRTAYHRRFVPPPSRDNPSPAPERMAQIREMARIQERLSDLETRVRSMAVPTQDRVWERFRGEKALLNQLLLHDYNLIAPSRELRDSVSGVTPTDWSDDILADLEARINSIEQAIRARADFLRIPGA